MRGRWCVVVVVVMGVVGVGTVVVWCGVWVGTGVGPFAGLIAGGGGTGEFLRLKADESEARAVFGEVDGERGAEAPGSTRDDDDLSRERGAGGQADAARCAGCHRIGHEAAFEARAAPLSGRDGEVGTDGMAEADGMAEVFAADGVLATSPGRAASLRIRPATTSGASSGVM